MGILRIAEETANYLTYFQLSLGIFMIAIFIFENYYQYLNIEDGVITKYSLRRRSLKLAQVEKIRKFAGDYTLYSSEKQLKINSELVNKHQRPELEKVLRSLEIPFEETPATKYNYKQS